MMSQAICLPNTTTSPIQLRDSGDMTTPTNGIADASVNNDVGASGVAVPASAPAPPKKTAASVDATSESHQAAPPAPSTPKNPSTPRKPRGPTKAQQLATTYQYPLPLRTFPLPPLIPHNPLSILHLLYTYISQVLSPPTSHVAVYTGTFSLSLRAVHITDPTHIRALWEQGFYGKGSLSRSELSWLDREKRRIGEGASKTSEEVTRQRREERQQIKWKRARLQREMVEAKRREEEMARDGGEGADVVVDEVVDAVVGHIKPILGEGVKGVAPTGPLELLAMPNSKAEVGGEGTTPAQSDASAPSPSDVDVSASTTPPAESSTSIVNTASSPTAKNVTFSPITEQQANLSTATEDAEELSLVIHDKEHLQLTTEEAFFLHYGLGVLSIYPSSSSSPSPSPSTARPIPTQQLLAQFRSSSYFPVLADSSEEAQQAVLRPDDNFMINYTVYHHFRSLGWVVRGGVKFGGKSSRLTCHIYYILIINS